jgi:CubicO group peptidase (beta-lactamase class C family)
MKYILLCLGCFLCHFSLKSQNPINKIDALLRAYEEIGYNAVIFAGNKDSVQYSKAIGFKDIRKKVPMELSTSFKIESAGKLFTATRIMQLVEEKKLKVDDNINQYLPELKIPNGHLITIHHLLNHTSGLASHWETSQFNPSKNYSLEEIVAATPLRFSNPGEKTYYSNTAYFILAGLIEKIDGMPFHQSIHKNIFLPAGMKQTGPLTENKLPPGTALPYYQVTTSEYAEDTTSYIASTQLGAGGWISTAGDLFKFAQAYLKNKYLSNETINIQLTANETKADTSMGFRYGVMKLNGNKDIPAIFGHNGGGRGFSVDVFFEKKSGTIVVMCANLYGVGYGITRNIFYAMLKDSLATNISSPAHIALGSAIRKKGTGYLLKEPDSLFKELNINPSERLLINTAENFMQIKDYSTARDILKVTRSKYPESSNALLISGKVAIKLNEISAAKELLNSAIALASKNKDQYVLDEAGKLINNLN